MAAASPSPSTSKKEAPKLIDRFLQRLGLASAGWRLLKKRNLRTETPNRGLGTRFRSSGGPARPRGGTFVDEIAAAMRISRAKSGLQRLHGRFPARNRPCSGCRGDERHENRPCSHCNPDFSVGRHAKQALQAWRRPRKSLLVAAAEKICAAAGGRIASVIGDFLRVNASAAAAMPAFASAKSAAGPAPRANAAAATRSPVTSGFGAEKS